MKDKKAIKTKLEKIKDNYENKFNLFEVVIMIFIAGVFGLIIGSILSYKSGSSLDLESKDKVQEFISTYHNIVDNYYDKVDEDKLIEAAIAGMVESLDDPYSSFISDNDLNSFNETLKGSYVGIGVTVSFEDNTNKIIEIIKGSGAQKAGLQIGDIIIKVDGKDVSHTLSSDLSKMIKGKENTKVKVTVLRNNKEKTYTITRSAIELTSASSKIIEKNNKNIGYLQITNISSNTYSQVKKQLKSLENKKITSLIIDLRNNPGGQLSQADKILDIFFDNKTVLYQIESKTKKTKIYAENKDKKNYPVAIIINKESASASEIIASCFQDNYKNSYIIGEKSYGKGTVQKAIELKSGISFKYTSQKWLTSKGKWLNEIGLTPDYEVFNSNEYKENPKDELDNQLQKALEILTEKK